MRCAARALVLSRWHLVAVVAAVCAVAAAVWAIIDDERSTAVIALLQAVALVGIAVLLVRTGTLERRLKKDHDAVVKTLKTLGTRPAGETRDEPSVQLVPGAVDVVNLLGIQRADAALRHDELLAAIEQLRTGLSDQRA